MMKNYWFAATISYPFSLILLAVVTRDLDLCSFTGIIMLGVLLSLGKYFEELEALEKEKKDAGQPTEPT